MKAEEVGFYDWQKRFTTHNDCFNHLIKLRWPDGFQCPHCGHDHGYFAQQRGHYECARCHRQTSVMSNTLFHAKKLPLTKWFWAIYGSPATKEVYLPYAFPS